VTSATEKGVVWGGGLRAWESRAEDLFLFPVQVRIRDFPLLQIWRSSTGIQREKEGNDDVLGRIRPREQHLRMQRSDEGLFLYGYLSKNNYY